MTIEEKERREHRRVMLAHMLSLQAAKFVAWGLPEPTPEYKFHPDRKWRFDWAWIEPKVALEVEGGVWIKKGHTRPIRFVGDIEKYNAAMTLGWILLRCQPTQLRSGEIVDVIRRALAIRSSPESR